MSEIKAMIDEVIEQFKGSKTGRTVLGDDGKFDREDVERMSEGTKTAVKDAVDNAKKVFGE